MAQDIEEFLRMAAARKKQQAAPPQAAPPPPLPPTQAYPPQQYPAQQYPAQQYPAQQYPAQQYPAQSADGIYILGDEDVEQSHPDLQSRIRTTVSTDDIAEHASHLGEGVHSRSNVVENRVSQKFDHDLGQLRKAELEDPAVVDHGKGVEKTTDIGPVLKLIRNPNSLKQAIILKEIFDRPKF